MKHFSLSRRALGVARRVKGFSPLRAFSRWMYIRSAYDAQTLGILRQYATPLLLETRSFPELAQYEIGAWTYGRPSCLYGGYGSATLKIGKFCSIAGDVKILLAGEHRLNTVSTYPFDYMFTDAKDTEKWTGAKGDVVIGNDVWIGEGALVMSGVRIGDGAVVAARAVVNKDVPPYAIVGGIPSKIIRYRFTPEIAAALLRIRWWDWPMERINSELKALCGGDVAGFVAAHDK